MISHPLTFGLSLSFSYSISLSDFLFIIHHLWLRQFSYRSKEIHVRARIKLVCVSGHLLLIINDLHYSWLYLNKLKDSEGWDALLDVNTTQNTVKLSVETAVAKPQQETAQHCDGHAKRNQNTFIHNTAAVKCKPSDQDQICRHSTLETDKGFAACWFQKPPERHSEC